MRKEYHILPLKSHVLWLKSGMRALAPLLYHHCSGRDTRVCWPTVDGLKCQGILAGSDFGRAERGQQANGPTSTSSISHSSKATLVLFTWNSVCRDLKIRQAQRRKPESQKINSLPLPLRSANMLFSPRKCVKESLTRLIILIILMVDGSV